MSPGLGGGNANRPPLKLEALIDTKGIADHASAIAGIHHAAKAEMLLPALA